MLTKSLTRKELIKRLDCLRQTYARYEGARKRGGKWWNKCVTCGKDYVGRKRIA